jgi:hypothetical protein
MQICWESSTITGTNRITKPREMLSTLEVDLAAGALGDSGPAQIRLWLWNYSQLGRHQFLLLIGSQHFSHLNGLTLDSSWLSLFTLSMAS